MPARLYETLEELPQNFIDCRDLRHAWYDPLGQKSIVTEGRYLRRLKVCDRCGTKRTEILTTKGKRVSTPHYDYPDGYLLKPVKGRRFTAADVRGVAIQAARRARKKVA